MPINDGGPAFPKADTVESKDVYSRDYPMVREGNDGMSLRHWTATKLLVGLMSMTKTPEDGDVLVAKGIPTAIKLADQLITALKSQPQ